MASEILGLFGGKNPQQLRGDVLDSLLVSPAQMGSQSLLQQVVSMGRNAGSMIGMGAGQLLGGKVAGEVEAAYLDDAIKAASAVKGTPAEKMQAVAEYLADKPGMGAQYMKAMEEANRLKAQGLQLEEAQFKAQNRTRENKETRMVYNPLTQQDEPKTFYWTEEWKNGQWVQKTMPTATTSAKPKAPDVNPLDAEDERRKKLRAGGYGSSQPSAAPNVIESATAKAAEKINMAPLIAEANIERAGYNSAEQQVQAEEKRLRDMSSVQTLPPEIIKHFDIEDARRILRDQYAYLNEAQKRELRKRIAQGRMTAPTPPRAPSAPKGDITGSRLF